MRCFHPLEAAHKGVGDKPVIFRKGERPAFLADGYMPVDLRCGQCIGCRLTDAQDWMVRIMHEAKGHRACFITLTYDDEFLPYGKTLVPYHLELFWKRLRRRLEPIKIKYYACGEYGSTCEDHAIKDCPVCGPLQRPHYHAIIIGFDFPDKKDLTEREGYPVFTSDFLSSVWTVGIHEIGILSHESAGYVARYCTKKVTGKPAEEHYKRYLPGVDLFVDLQPEFGRMSNGLGQRWLSKHVTDVYPSDEVPVSGKGVLQKVPRYYDKIFERSNAIEMVDIKLERERLFLEHENREQPSLASREKVALAKNKMLTRSL